MKITEKSLGRCGVVLGRTLGDDVARQLGCADDVFWWIWCGLLDRKRKLIVTNTREQIVVVDLKRVNALRSTRSWIIFTTVAEEQTIFIAATSEGKSESGSTSASGKIFFSFKIKTSRQSLNWNLHLLYTSQPSQPSKTSTKTVATIKVIRKFINIHCTLWTERSTFNPLSLLSLVSLCPSKYCWNDPTSGEDGHRLKLVLQNLFLN